MTDAGLGRLHVIIDAGPTPTGGRDDGLALAGAVLSGPVLAIGTPVVQVRVKGVIDRVRLDLVSPLAARCAASGAACIVNDRADVALATGAGWHGGADDLPVAVARRLLGAGALIGGTARDPEAARRAEADGASYIGVGPVYATASKDGLPDPIGLATLAAVAEAVHIPVIAIAGITAARVPEVLDAGAYGVAVIGAVRDAPDPAAAVVELLVALATPTSARPPA